MITPATWLRQLRKALKARWIAMRALAVRCFLSYGRDQLLQALRQLGVRDGDALMLHAGFAPHHGYRGTIESLTDTLIEAIGPDGHLLMVSLPYRSSSLQYLEKLRQFDVRRTPSMMGMVSEYFRRRPEVLRSLHPTHPILVRGPRAEDFIRGHEDCLHPCGPGTPFDRLAQADGLVAFLNVPFGTFTFFHYLEHLVAPGLPFPLYTPHCHEVSVIDRDGLPRTVRTHVYTPETISRRRFEVLENALRARNAIRRVRVGNTVLEAVRVRAAIACVEEMTRRGEYFYDFSAMTPPVAPPPQRHPIEGA